MYSREHTVILNPAKDVAVGYLPKVLEAVLLGSSSRPLYSLMQFRLMSLLDWVGAAQVAC